MQRIYFDNASTTPMHPEVVSVMTEIMNGTFGNPSSIHMHGRTSRSIIEAARKTVAKALEASIGEIFFTSCATEAINTVLKMAVENHQIKRIISSPTEHHCTLHTLEFIEKTHHLPIIYLDVDENGNPDMSQLQALLQEETPTLVTLMYVNNEIGTMIDLDVVSELCAPDHVFFHCDAVQAVGKIPVSVGGKHIDYLSSSAHKFHGPKGVGFFYMNGDSIIPPYILGGAQERNMRAGTENIYGIAGLEKALEIQLNRQADTYAHILQLRNHFKEELSKLGDIQFNGNQEDHFMPHILSVSFPPSPKGDMLMFNLDISGISASSGSACSSGIENDSHVLQAIGHPAERKSIRFSFSEYNTMEEVDQAINLIKSILE